MKEKITIYTNETCPYCKTIKETLEKEGVKFKEKSVTKFAKEWQEITDLTGIPTYSSELLGHMTLDIDSRNCLLAVGV